jgi:hypothetical protein
MRETRIGAALGAALGAAAIMMQGPAGAVEMGNVAVGGNYLGVYNDFDQQSELPTDASRRQFDFAANLDFRWAVHERVTGIVQLQGGTGAGSIPLGDPQIGNPAFDIVVTDLNAEIKVLDAPDLTLTVGSFDMPFGSETDNLTNNADATRNSFYLNDIFYSPFGGVTGTLNTVGVKADAAWPLFDLTAVLSNGTDESASNPDGNFAWLVGAGWEPIEGLRIAGSWMVSDDTEPRGQSGFGADFRGWIADARYEFTPGAWIRGYVGALEYGDNDPATCDDVGVWAGEARYGRDRWHFALRVSGWDPDDDDGSGAGASSILPNPGLGRNYSDGILIVRDQRVTRLQLGVGYGLFENFAIKGEWFRDDYEHTSGGRASDVRGFIAGLQGTF